MKRLLNIILSAIVLAGMQSTPISAQTLKEAFKDKFFIGVAVNRFQIQQRNEAEVKLITSQFNSVTAENDMKWMHIHPKIDSFNFEHADKLVELAQANDMFVVGHTLVWHSQLARWVFNKEDGSAIDSTELFRRMKDHIHTIVGRYKGKIKGWDVVNEALAEDGTLRKSQFLAVGGESFIEKAFQYAHEADPQAELYYNDYNMTNPEKRDGAIRIIKNLQSKGIQIDGVGMQGHWHLETPTLEQIETAIEMYGALGVKVMVTELDISVLPNPNGMPTADISARSASNPAMNPYPDGLPDSVQTQLADRYAAIFKLFNKHADKISRVTFWGLHDGLSWKNNFPIRGRTDYTLLFDRNLAPKKAYHAVIETTKK
ncbi:MAG: endo-1,4-beta-xylanase [Saprospiraceae bacterium]|nr:endo-1,4-beta-xylanase [Saprospiraceae bacterium]